MGRMGGPDGMTELVFEGSGARSGSKDLTSASQTGLQRADLAC